MIIPDMLKNAPMFKRLDAKIKLYISFAIFVISKVFYELYVYMKGFASWNFSALPYEVIIVTVAQN
jgi:hypothetical protein